MTGEQNISRGSTMNKIPLKTFWEAVEQQLAAYSADELAQPSCAASRKRRRRWDARRSSTN